MLKKLIAASIAVSFITGTAFATETVLPGKSPAKAATYAETTAPVYAPRVENHGPVGMKPIYHKPSLMKMKKHKKAKKK